ncbi:MAG: beta strand repeat-containing protein, partial [bacterium]
SMGSIAVSDNNTEAQSGSGSAVGGDAARAITDNSPTISFTTSNLTLSSASATFLAQKCGTYTTNADSVYATAVGGSAARALNTSNPNLTLNLGSGTAITANGSVVVKAQNDMTGLGDASNMNGKTGGIMARVGGGGIVGGFGGTSVSCMTMNSAVSLGNDVSISTSSRGGNILIGSSLGWNTYQLTYMHDSTGIGGGGVHSSLTSCLTNNIALGSNVKITALAGSVSIGTNINSQTKTDSYDYTFTLVGGSRAVAENNLTSCQSVTVGQNSLLKAAGGISVTAGSNPVSGAGTLQDNFALVTAHGTGLASIPGTSASSNSNSNLSVSLGSGSQIISDRDVNLGAQPGINNAQWYTFANMDGAKGKTHSGTTGATQTSCVTINGNVIAGNTHQLAINIPESGTTATVNGQAVNLANIGSCLTNVIPQPNSSFLPFQASYNSNYNATQLLSGLDPTSKAILEKSISTSPVKAITLANLAATGGQVVIYASTSLAGTGKISAFSPNITVNNNSPAYLLLDGIGIPNTLNMGKITVVGNVGVPAGMTLNQQPAKPSITINENYAGVVGNGTTSGPAIAITGPIVNTGGSVSIFNACGALVQDAPINAAAVSISTPNSAYIVNTPKNYMGTGGSIADYWMNTSTNLVQNSGFESPGLGSGSSAYQYNPTGASWTFTGTSGISGNGSGFTSGNPSAPAGGQVAFLQETGVMSQ